MDIEIKLTQGKAGYLSQDDKASTGVKWCAAKYGNTFYVARVANKKTILLHREVKERELGRPLIKGEYVDHVDGDGLNNRRTNLRLATKSQNEANSARMANNTSGYVGVTFYCRHSKWYSQIQINNKSRCLGYFDNILDAARAYDLACIKIFGEFARPNYPAAAYGLTEWPPKDPK